jgi:hypothetical protein
MVTTGRLSFAIRMLITQTCLFHTNLPKKRRSLKRGYLTVEFSSAEVEYLGDDKD